MTANLPLQKVYQYANELCHLLDEEFDALKTQNLSKFEQLQSKKEQTLRFLSNLEPIKNQMLGTVPVDGQKNIANDPFWIEILQLFEICQNRHARNGLLITRKLDTIKSAIASLRSHNPSNSVELYDSLGKMRPGKARRKSKY